MRTDQTKQSKSLSNLYNEKYGLNLGEFNHTIGTEWVPKHHVQHLPNMCLLRDAWMEDDNDLNYDRI